MIEFIYYYAYKLTGNCALSIFVLSLSVNLLVLPLYNRADDLQLKAKAKEDEIRPMADHIKKSFKGDEKVMMLQTYYREAGYSQLNSFKSAISLLLQIPFFMAAYYFLSELRMLNGISLGPIADLGKPDALIALGSVKINLLPIVMTVINVIASFIYAGKQSVKDKLKLIGMALFFLVLLYGSPSGLVFYWTLNNVFSLVKNIVLLLRKLPSENRKITKHDKLTHVVFLLSCAVLAVITGILIPAEVVSKCPAELINSYSSDAHSPTFYILSSVLIAIGTFLVWIPVFYYLTMEKTAKIASAGFAAMAAMGSINYFVFNKNFGFLSKRLVYDLPITFTAKEIVLNILADLVIVAVVIFFAQRKKMIMKNVVAVLLAAVFFLSILPLGAVLVFFSSYDDSYANSPEDIKIPMTTTGQNVVVIMMDRMLGAYIPYIFNERPDVAAQFDGFTYYPNTISFGKSTNFGVPAVFGGYEYTPMELNARPDELLVDKHNESLCVMPQIFADNGWNVTVGDPSYANYEWTPDVSIFDYNDDIHAYQMAGVLNPTNELLSGLGESYDIRLNRNLFCFGLMKIMPYFLQPIVYSEGSYNYMNFSVESFANNDLSGNGEHVQYGLMANFLEEKTVLDNLNDLVEVSSDPVNCFFMFANGTTHETTLLSEPEYMPEVFVDNTEYDLAHEDRFTVDGVTMHMDTSPLTYSVYESNVAACIALGNWFDYLRANGLYDNTRIIIVADHGDERLGQFDELMVEELEFDALTVNPVLLVKDFDSSGYTVSYDFMTNADTPYIAMQGVISDPVNPFTGNPIAEADKDEEQIIYISDECDIGTNNGCVFVDPDGYWLNVNDNIWDDENWSICETEY